VSIDLNSSKQPLIMGVINITPDSYFTASRAETIDKAVTRAVMMAEAGADVIDIGAESSRPGAEPLSLSDEMQRLKPVLSAIRSAVTVPISIDTYKPEVMQFAVDAGVDIINDIYALRQPGALEMASKLAVPVCLMHMQKSPDIMQQKPTYQDVTEEVCQFFVERIAACQQAGINFENIWLDIGFGFGKSVNHNLKLVNELPKFLTLTSRIMVGLSRKNSISRILNKPTDQLLAGSLAATALAIVNGARMIRCHDVAETRDAISIASVFAKGYWKEQ